MARILVVDDEAGVRKPLRTLLEGQGHQVVEAADGIAGITLAENSDFDVMITDIVMPGTGGLETIMKLHRTRPGLGLIVMSGRIPKESESVRTLVRQFGVSRILYKPIEKSELLDALAAALNHTG